MNGQKKLSLNRVILVSTGREGNGRTVSRNGLCENGIDKVIQEKQRQLDLFLSEKTS